MGESTDRFLEHLVAFVNRHAGARERDGAAGSAPELAEAIRTKSAEDLLLAREHIERGGDYAKAIDILSSARVIDPGNQELAAAQAEAERLRYVDEERFSRIENGMTEDDVRAELGQVKQQNVRYPAAGQVVWLYPREDGAAAAVFFRAGPDGVLEVDDTNFEAVPAPSRAAGGRKPVASRLPIDGPGAVSAMMGDPLCREDRSVPPECAVLGARVIKRRKVLSQHSPRPK